MRSSTDSTESRVLVLATSELGGPCIARELHDRGIDGDTEIKVVAPVLASSRSAERTGAMDREHREAQERLCTSLACLEADGLRADGWVGDSDPVLALEDAVAEFDFDTVIVATHRESIQAFAEENLAAHIAGRVETDVVHVVLDCDDTNPLREIEEIAAAPLVAHRMARRGRRARRDLMALAVGAIGTVILGILLLGAGHLRDGDPREVAQALLGVGIFSLTFWGGAEILFGEAVDRRGGATGRIAETLLVAAPPAVIVTAILAVA